MPFQKGNPGRPKGAKNLVTKSVKANIVSVFEGMGGIAAMLTWATAHPELFYAIYARLIPHEATDDGGAPLPTTVIHEYVNTPKP